MTPLEKLQQHLNVTITNFDNYCNNELQLTECMTADGYNIYLYLLTEDHAYPNWENDVYYYQPDFNTIMGRIIQVARDTPGAKILMDNVDEYLEDYEIERMM
jgi:hypothetical protein